MRMPMWQAQEHHEVIHEAAMRLVPASCQGQNPAGLGPYWDIAESNSNTSPSSFMISLHPTLSLQ